MNHERLKCMHGELLINISFDDKPRSEEIIDQCEFQLGMFFEDFKPTEVLVPTVNGTGNGLNDFADFLFQRGMRMRQ